MYKIEKKRVKDFLTPFGRPVSRPISTPDSFARRVETSSGHTHLCTFPDKSTCTPTLLVDKILKINIPSRFPILG